MRGRGEGTDVPAQQGDVEIGIRGGEQVEVHAGMGFLGAVCFDAQKVVSTCRKYLQRICMRLTTSMQLLFLNLFFICYGRVLDATGRGYVGPMSGYPPRFF